MPVDLIQNISGFGDVVDRLIEAQFDLNILRPWRGRDGRSYVTRVTRNARGEPVPRSVVTNAPATLPKDTWFAMDQAVIRGLQDRLRAFRDIRAAGLEFRLPSGIAHTMLQYQTVGDITPATVSMDPERRGEADQPTMDFVNFPLPVIHKDWDYSARHIAASRLPGGQPIDTLHGELAGRKIAEELERMTVAGNFSFGGGTVWGYTTLPSRLTKTDMTVPTGANGPAVLSDILTLRQLLISAKHFGPYRCYVNPQWSVVLDNDFSGTKGDQTLRQRILAIEGIQSVETIDFLPNTNWHIVLVEMSSETVRVVVGMEVITVQWESVGGWRKHFKSLALLVPQLRADTAGTSGVAHGKTVAA